ncbi:MAG TPA: TlpA disulfide reductase family protein [Myxococcota bacterium]|nr:TlpA disulfide reductase family protein [Myxococcota bacterium]
MPWGSEVRVHLACAAALALVGASAPEVASLETLDGDAIEVTRAPDENALVLHFWATWCPDCADELPALDRSARACEGHGVRVLMVNVGDPADEVRRFAKGHGVELPVLLDPHGRVWRGAGLRGLPANLVWTRDGEQRSEGPASAARWREQLAALGCTPE